eukprot:jgi/Botrbrau1/1831/Bobra.146_1s0026.1
MLKCVLMVLAILNVLVHSEDLGPAQTTSASPSETELLGRPPRFEIPDIADINRIFYQFALQLFPAKVTDTFPTGPIPDGRLSRWIPGLEQYKMKVCDKALITDCMPSNNATSALPERIQGIWWADGLGDPTLAINYGGGEYDAPARMLVINTYSKGLWAFDGTNSTWEGTSWSISGAALFNAALFARIVYRIYFNEDFTFGQIFPTWIVGGLTTIVPVWIDNLTMDWIGRDAWMRRSTAFGAFDIHGGDYALRRIINGDGSPGYWFDKGWLNYKGDIPLAVGIPINLPD